MDNESYTGFQTLYSSRTGFFRILVAKHLGRKVVIKTLKEECSDNQIAVTQLKKEFGVLFPLVSPNVVQALSMLRIGNGTPAFEMEWCDGKDIRSLMADSITPGDAVEIVRGVLNGLKDIHLAGIVHRDIKPENVRFDPLRKVVKIIDFGCAYVTGGLVLQGPDGTPGYTPEDKMIAGVEAEPKDDLYALGVMTAEMAECLSVSSKKDSAVRKKLKRFSDKLLARGYDKAQHASEEFEKTFRKKRIPYAPLLISLSVVIAFLLILLGRMDQKPALSHDISSIGLKPDSGVNIGISPVAESPEEPSDGEEMPEDELEQKQPEIQENLDATPEDMDPVIKTPALPGDYLNPYSGVSAEDEAAYELAIVAGKLMQIAQSSRASQQIRMDAFVVRFCDSVFRAEEIDNTLPKHYLNDDELRDVAKNLADRYTPKMEKVFSRNFNEPGNPHRRKVMLEGRFYNSARGHNDRYYIEKFYKKSN